MSMTTLGAGPSHANGMKDQRAPLFEGTPKTISVLGATGTIGRNTLSLVQDHPDRFIVHSVVANKDANGLAELAKSVGAKRAVVADTAAYGALKDNLAGTDIEPACGGEAINAACDSPVEFVMAGIVGFAGLESTLHAIKQGMCVALANKECLVAGGSWFMNQAQSSHASLLPVDSEHNAIFQAMACGPKKAVSKITLTASGGPFRTWSKAEMANVTVEKALKHPNWSMGAKITIDSATMMNKGLEVIEAAHLFGVPLEQLEVLVHPQSIIHGMVQFVDGSILAQLGPPDMRVPIANTLSWPDRIDVRGADIDLARIAKLHFEKPDLDRFPCLALALDAYEAGDWATCALNAANEVAVERFLKREVSYLSIPQIIEKTIEKLDRESISGGFSSFSEICAVDQEAREIALTIDH